jgi:hypothetical protein
MVKNSERRQDRGDDPHHATAEDADLFLPIAPGRTPRCSALLVHLADLARSTTATSTPTDGFGTRWRARAIAPDLTATARLAGLPAADIARFFGLFHTIPNAVTCRKA